MSHLLAWYGNHGVAQRLGHTIKLRAAPDLGEGQVHELEYAPASGVRTVRPRAIDERRDLTILEEAACLETLRAFVPSEPAPL